MQKVEKNLPQNWKYVKVGDSCCIVGGGTPKREISEYFGGNIVWLTPTEIDKTQIRYISQSREYITELGLKKSSAKIISKGSVLLTTRATIGNIAIAGIDLATNQGVTSFYCPDFICNIYMAYWLRSIKNELLDLAKGTTFKEISKAEIKKLDFPLPPLLTQQSIVSKIEELFSELDKSIEQLKTAQLQLKTYRQAVLKWAFEGRLTNDVVKEGELPEGWKWVKLEEIASSIDPHPSHRTPPIVKNGIPFVSIKDFDSENDKINFDNAREVSPQVLKEHLERYELKVGDFVIGKIGTIGQPVRIVIPQNYALSANIVLIQPKIVNPSFLFYYFKSPIIEKLFKSGMKATTQSAFGIQKVRELFVNLPFSEEEQHQIVSEIESRLSVADKLEDTIKTSLQQAESLRQSILKQAFEGKLL